jgi:uncharacterized ferritin-like protein (DUF455 family)
MKINPTLASQKIEDKLALVESSVHGTLNGELNQVPDTPGRDLSIFKAGELPPKKGLSHKEGQARLLHDLASIELQAMELGLRTLCEFPEAPESFRQQLADITLSEARHLRLCLQGLEKLGFSWGTWPTHLALWNSVSTEDSFLDRILIVHRYLEGSGLDAGDTFLRKLDGVLDNEIHPIVKIIATEEVDHVLFGSNWYHEICKRQNIDPENDYVTRMESIRFRVPKRIEKISHSLRKKAGFTDFEIQYLENLRSSIVKFKSLNNQVK